jgi:hypothetical protein
LLSITAVFKSDSGSLMPLSALNITIGSDVFDLPDGKFIEGLFVVDDGNIEGKEAVDIIVMEITR